MVVWSPAMRYSTVVQGNQLGSHSRTPLRITLCLSVERREAFPTRHPRRSDEDRMKSEIDCRLYFVFVHCTDTNVDVEEESDIFTQGKSDVFNVHRLVDIN